MFCPRCGRPVNENANYCGGCGMPKADIIKYLERQREALKTPAIPPVEIDEIKYTNAEPQHDTEPVSADDYITEAQDITNEIEDFVAREQEEEAHPDFEQLLQDVPAAPTQEQYSRPQEEYDNVTEPVQERPVYNYAKPIPLSEDYAPEMDEETRTLSTADFLWMLILSGIPVVGLFYLLYQAFSGRNKNKRSFARATLIFGVYAFVLAVVFVMGAAIALY